MKIPKANIQRLDESEWNFSSELVPDRELRPCFFYEYTREFAKKNTRLIALIRELQAISQMSEQDPRKSSREDIEEEIFSTFPPEPLSHLFCSPRFVNIGWRKLPLEKQKQILAKWEAEEKRPSSFQEFICLKIILERELPEWEKCSISTYEVGVQRFVLP
jgi:hypothetical protein